MKVVEQGRHGGTRCEFVRLLYRPMSLVLVLLMFETANLPSGTVVGWGFGMFCLFRAALLSALLAVYWLGMVQNEKG
jgi:hypothetical protein